jgi:hypothetical protein
MGLSLKKPSREHGAKRAKADAERLGAGEKRIVVDVPEDIHRQVRLKCLQRGVLVRDYILELVVLASAGTHCHVFYLVPPRAY